MPRLLRRALAALALLAAVPPALAQAPDPKEAIVLAVRVNQVARGDALVVPVEGSRDLWVREGDTRRFGLALPPPGEAMERSGEFVRFRDSPRLGLAVDLDRLELAIEAAPDLLARQQFSLSMQPPLQPAAQGAPNGFVNWAVGRQAFTGSASTTTADVLVNAAVRDWVARSDWHWVSQGRADPLQRGRSFLLHDDTGRMLRWSAGDVQPAGGYASRSPAVAGIAVERLFAVSPGFTPSPTTTLAGSVRSPAVAEIYVDGARIRTIDLAPGTYEFRDLSYFSGLRNVEVVLRDRAGNIETLKLPVYFAGDSLRAGLHEFRYAAGSPRTSWEGEGAYAGFAVSGRHRYGLTDDVTVGASFESVPGYRAAGIQAVARVVTLGLVGANLAWSQGDAGRQGQSVLASWSYGGRRASASATAFFQTRDFGAMPGGGLSLAPGRPRERLAASIGTGIGPQRTLTVDASRGRTWDGPSDSLVAARLSQGLANGAAVDLAVAWRDDGRARGTDVSIGVSIPLGSGVTLNSVAVRRAGEAARLATSASSSMPAGEGLGWRVNAEHEADITGADAHVRGNGRFAAASASVRRVATRGQAASTGTDVRLEGSIAAIGDRVFLSRPVAQSFALAEVPGLEGVRIYQNGQLAGRTDAQGRLLVPALGGYGVNQLAIDDRDVPVDREIKQVRIDVVPRDFVGAVARFETKRVSSLGGLLVAEVGGQPVAVASGEVTLRGAKGEAAGITGPEGDFHFDDLEPGRYEIEALNRRVKCRASVELPEGRGPFVDLGRVRCHAPAQ